MDLVDIGCGTGNYSEYFMQFEPRSLTLFDASEGMLNKAKGKVTTSASSKTMLSFHQVVLPDMPFQDNSFDAGMINLVRAIDKSCILTQFFFIQYLISVFLCL